jgi:hypothetical protein
MIKQVLKIFGFAEYFLRENPEPLLPVQGTKRSGEEV